jgi:hypothetical protein
MIGIKGVCPKRRFLSYKFHGSTTQKNVHNLPRCENQCNAHQYLSVRGFPGHSAKPHVGVALHGRRDWRKLSYQIYTAAASTPVTVLYIGWDDEWIIVFLILVYLFKDAVSVAGGRRWHNWLRHDTTSSIPGGVIGIFNLLKTRRICFV